MRGHLRRLSPPLLLVALSLAFASTSSAYFYYVHYTGRSGPFTPILERFDLNALGGKTLPFFISDQGPALLVGGDSYIAIVSEIRAAAKVWNDVATSDIRLSYGGLISAGTVQNAPAVRIDFSDDIPPGLIALSGPESRAPVTQGTNGQFIPILQSHMLLKRDMSQIVPNAPSYSEAFFTTLVHEFGHTLGLQHTLTSSVMSTAQTSTSTRAAPLSSDDIAGISLLYPAAGYQATTGSISGRVTLSNGNGVNLASVVAISTSNAAISTLTNPDGTFEIDGLPPQQYYLYVHALPPPMLGETYPANITPQIDLNRTPFAAGPAFTTQFYPNTRDFNQAQFIFVYAGNVTPNINFTVATRSTAGISGVRVYQYTPAGLPVSSPQLFVGVPVALVAGAVNGLVQNGSLIQGMNVSMMGTAAQIYGLRPWYQQFVTFDVQVGNATGPGPKHLLFSSPSDLYVLPSGYYVVQNAPPAITSISPGFDNTGARIVTIGGTDLQPDTRIYFDGLPGMIQGTTSDGKWIVAPPAGPPGYTATVVALNTSDPQSSLFLQTPNPPTFTYDPGSAAVLAVSPQFLTPGSDTVVDVMAQNTNFIDGQVLVGFGTSDVIVKRVQVVSPTHLSITATAPSGTFVSTSTMNITNGLRILSQSQGTSILPPSSLGPQ